MPKQTKRPTLKLKDLAPKSGEAEDIKGCSSPRDTATGQAKRV